MCRQKLPGQMVRRRLRDLTAVAIDAKQHPSGNLCFTGIHIRINCLPSSTRTRRATIPSDWQGPHMSLLPMGTDAGRSACTAQRHFLWGAGRYRAELACWQTDLRMRSAFPRRSSDVNQEVGIWRNGVCVCLMLIESDNHACQRCTGLLGARHRD